MKILVTGFDPFGGEKINPAIEAVKKLPDKIANAKIIKLEIPTSYKRSEEVIRYALQNEKPDYVLNVGQAGGRACLTPERIAINLDDSGVPDNDHDVRIDKKIEAKGATAYFTQLPIKKEVAAIRKAGIPAMISDSAGTFVCNHLFYEVQYLRTTKYPKLKAGFIHIPFLPEQVSRRPRVPSMSLTDIIKGLTAAIGAIAENDK